MIGITISEKTEKAFKAKTSGENRFAFLISGKIDFKLKLFEETEGRLFNLIKGTIN